MAELSGRHDDIQGEILHEYDGIEEADNQLPLWWVVVLLGTVVFAIVYWFAFHVYEAGDSPADAYATRMVELEQRRAEQAAKMTVTEELLVSLSEDEEALSAGAVVFKQNCEQCHLEKGQGKIGPNLTDNHWIHGADPMTIYRTVNGGVLQKGMPAWGPMLGPRATQQVTAFVLTLRNTNVPGKAPEGKPVSP